MRKRILSLVVLGISLLTACNKTDNEYEPVVGNELAFKVNEISDTKGTPISSFADGSKAGVYGYLTPNGGSAPTTADVMNNQELTLDGTSWNYSPAKEWSDDVEDVYNFYAYYPYTDTDGTTNTTGVTPSNAKGELSINYKVPTACINQPDLMIAKATVKSKSEAVELDFKHALSTVSFKVKGDPSKVITKITVSNIFIQGNLTYGESGVEWKTAGKRTTAEYNAKINNSVTPSDEIQDLTTSDGYLMMIPQVIPDAGITVNITIDGKSKALKITKDMVENGKWEANKQYSYVINAQNIVDFDKSFFYNFPNVSNCYIIKPATETDIIIPINEYISYFWTNYGSNATEKGYADLSGLTAKVLWCDADKNPIKSVKIIDVDPGTTTKDNPNVNYPDFTASTSTKAMKITKTKNISGNVVIAVKSGETVVWSWHLWISSYNPYDDVTSNGTTYTVDSDLEGTKLTWMDRNIGARQVEFNPGGKGFLYYQWGRKDPFSETLYNTDLPSYIQLGTAPTNNIADGVKNPSVFYSYNDQGGKSGDWCGSYDSGDFQDSEYHWRDNKLAKNSLGNTKSIFDPSPLGFMVPCSTSKKKYVSPFTFLKNLAMTENTNNTSYSFIYPNDTGFIFPGMGILSSAYHGQDSNRFDANYWTASPHCYYIPTSPSSTYYSGYCLNCECGYNSKPNFNYFWRNATAMPIRPIKQF